MNIIPVGENDNLFRVTNVFPQEIIDFCLNAKWEDYKWGSQLKQENFPRHLLDLSSCPELSNLKQYSWQLADEIQKILNKKFIEPHRTHVSFWRDTYGYKSRIHRDFDPDEVMNTGKFSIPVSMQIYLSESNNDLGTKFYYDHEKTRPKYFFPFEVNTGYLQINDYDQWHEMIGPIGKDENRITCHFIFSEFVQ